MTPVHVNGKYVKDALIDSGAAVTVVNKQLVDSLGLTVTPAAHGPLVMANETQMRVEGYVDMTIRLAHTPVRLHAVYVPEISYPLIVGTNFLRVAGARIVCEGKVIWPPPDSQVNSIGTTGSDSRNNKVNRLLVEPRGHLVTSIGRTVVPPLSGMMIRGRVREGSITNSDVLIEPTKRKFGYGQVGLQLQRVKGGYVNVFVVNTSHRVPLTISNNLPLAYASDGHRLWCDPKGEVLTIDLLEEMAKPVVPPVSSAPSGNAAATPEDAISGEKSFATKPPGCIGRRKRRAVSKVLNRRERSFARLYSVDAKDEKKGPKPAALAEISPNLTEKEKSTLFDLMDEYDDLFTVDIRSTTPLVQHRIYTDGPPRKQRPYPTPTSQKAFVSKYIEESLAAGIIRPSCSPWSSPILLVDKKDGTKRFCVDYRGLNAATKKDVYPIPRVEDVLERLNGMRYFTTLDLVQSYYQIAIAEEDKEKTAFITEEGAFEYNVMPFGLTNAPATFQRLMHLVLAGLNWKMCLVYIDDILIFSRTFDEHMSHLRQVFDRLRAANLKLKPAKCRFAFNNTIYLGHNIGVDGVTPDPAKVEAINRISIDKWRDVSDVKTFLGMTGYYRRFIRGYADIAAPLTELLKKDAKFVVDKHVRRAFKRLKEALVNAPVLAYPRHEVPYVLQVDASNYGMGGVLTQFYNGEEHPIAYFSRKFTTSEKDYAIMERECLAMVESIKHFREYLYGRRFTVITDHKPLEHIDTFKAHNGRVARWRMTLSDYHFDVVARPGRLNANADALSRLPVNTISFEETFANTTNPKVLRKLQLKDRLLRYFIRYLENDILPSDNSLSRKIVRESELFCMQDGVLYHALWPDRRRRFTARLRLVVPSKLQPAILHAYHNDPMGAHQGIQRTYELIASRFYWPKLYQSVNDHVRSCVKCIAKKTPRVKKAGLMQPILANKPLEIVGVDILGPLPTTVRRHRYILVFSDYFTKFPICFPLKDIKAVTIANKLLFGVILEYGAPSRIVSDRGSQFMSEIFQEVCKAAESRHSPSTAFHPQTNGLVERFNHTLCVMLSMYVHDNPKDWDLFLPFVIHSYRNTPHSSTGFAPNELMRSYSPKTPLELRLPEIAHEVVKSTRAQFDEVQARIARMNEEVTERIKKAQRVQSEYYNANRRDISFEVGDRVWFYWPARGVNAPMLKLSLPWSGPYWITERIGPVNYRLMKPDGSTLKQKVHVDRLKLCSSTVGIPKEFITLHENDSFNPEIELREIDPEYPPVITEKLDEQQISPPKPTKDAQFTDIPEDMEVDITTIEPEEHIDVTSLNPEEINDISILQNELRKLSTMAKNSANRSRIKKFKQRIVELL